MSNTLKFQIQSLLEEKKEDTISGPMSPFEFAKEMAQHLEFEFNRLARVWFEDERIFQIRESDGLTGHDTLIIGCTYKDDLWLSLWVDKGTGGLPVAMGYASDREIIGTPIYKREKFVRKLTDADIETIFHHIFDNPNEIGIKGVTPDSENSEPAKH